VAWRERVTAFEETAAMLTKTLAQNLIGKGSA
jgi:hypothetical protein